MRATAMERAVSEVLGTQRLLAYLLSALRFDIGVDTDTTRLLAVMEGFGRDMQTVVRALMARVRESATPRGVVEAQPNDSGGEHRPESARGEAGPGVVERGDNR